MDTALKVSGYYEFQLSEDMEEIADLTFHALCQFSICNFENCLKSSTFRVTRIRPFTTDIAATCPSTNDGVRPFDDNLARSLACHSAALSS